MELDNNLKVERTDSSNEHFRKLVVLLDKELGAAYSEEYDFYHQYNKIDKINNVIVVYQNGKPVGCGAIKKYDSSTMEVKRMFTRPDSRCKGIAKKVLDELEQWTKELSFENCILETGIKQYAAIALYKKKGYAKIPNYGQYKGISNSICFLKKLETTKVK